MSINKSKPVYSTLQADPAGRHHLMVGCAEGGVALRRVIGELQSAPDSALSRTWLVVTDVSIEPLREFGLAGVESIPSTARLLAAVRTLLQRSVMGTRLYIAGPEHFIGRVMQIALEFNLNKDEIRAEQLGTLARRVHCAHCRTVTENVRTNIVACSGCSRWLAVRDHYSRRFAAYLGVMADAEAPGELPPVQEIYS